jgi:hypothetical protein
VPLIAWLILPWLGLVGGVALCYRPDPERRATPRRPGEPLWKDAEPRRPYTDAELEKLPWRPAQRARPFTPTERPWRPAQPRRPYTEAERRALRP